MKVLLILAGEPEVKADHAARIPIPIMSPPLTLLLLNAICQRAGHEVALLDTRMYMEHAGGEWLLNEQLLEQHIISSEAEVVGISFLSASALRAYRLAALCKRYGLTVVGGGLHASVAPEELIQSGSFDYVVQGEGEESFTLLLAEIQADARPRIPPATVVLTAPPVADLRLVPPVADYSIYKPVFEQYEGPAFRSIYVELSRGCFKSCTFCEVAKTGAAWSRLRKIPLATIGSSIEHAVNNYGVNYILVADSIGTVFKSHFLQFMALMAERYKEVTLQFNSTVDCWDEERAAAARQLRCTVWFGFESGSPRVLEFIQKGTSVEQAYRAARLCEANGIPCAFNVLLGLPGETEADYLKTLKVFAACPHVYPNPNIFNPLPGTALYEYCGARGLLKDRRDYSVWDAERIQRSERGPLKGVDYELVLKYYKLFADLQQEPRRSLAR